MEKNAKKYLVDWSHRYLGDGKYLTGTYIEQKSLELLQSIKPLQEWRVGVMPSLKGLLLLNKITNNT